MSAGLGGDDAAWMLRECVCTICNNQTFSKMESHVFKESHIALMRLYSQPTTRDGTPPSPLQAPTIVQLGNGPLAAGNFGAGGQANVFAQILRESSDGEESTFSIVGPDRPAIEALLASLMELLQDEVVLIEKQGARSFTSTPLTWMSNGYRASSSISATKPPAVGIWFESAHLPKTSDSIPAWTVFRRPQGQLVGRAPDLMQLAILLGELRPRLIEIGRAFAGSPTTTNQAQPGVHIGMKVKPLDVDRVLVKIGINLSAHLFGVDVVRRSEFDGAVAFVLGDGSPVRRAQLPPETFSNFSSGQHVFCLTTSPMPSGRQALVLTMRIYGEGAVDSFFLAEFDDAVPPVRQVAVFVDYAANRIQAVW